MPGMYFSISTKATISNEIYDVLGKEVRTLTENVFTAGQHTIIWNGLNNSGNQVTRGVYFYRMVTENFTGVKKALVLR